MDTFTFTLTSAVARLAAALMVTAVATVICSTRAGAADADEAVAARRPAVVAHRGASGYAPENTLASVKLAWEMKADAVEVDVYLTKDNGIILSHDATTTRVSGQNLKVSETDSSDLRKLDVGKWKDAKYAGERMPFLEEVLATIPSGRKLFIEIKCGPEIAPYLKETVERSGKLSSCVIISFNAEAAAAAKQALPRVPAYWLVSSPRLEDGTFKPYDLPALTRNVAEKGLDGLDAHYGAVDAAMVTWFEKRKQLLYVWTVNDVQKGVELAGMGVAGITTDYPDRMLAALKGEAPK